MYTLEGIHIKYLIAILYVLFLFPACIIPVDNSSEAVITINTRNIEGVVQPLIFGQNIEASDPKDIHHPHHNFYIGRTGDGIWDPINRNPVPETVAFADEIGISILRYPGGCLVHNFDWHNAVGPLVNRPNYTFGIDEFIIYCKSINAEPLINMSAYIGGPQDMADLVEYCNAPATEEFPWAQKRAEWGHPEPYNVKFWEMGNESDHGNHNLIPSKKHSALSYSQWFNDSVYLMKNIDPNIKAGIIFGTGTGPSDPWNRIVLENCNDLIDFVSIHTYAVSLWHHRPTEQEIPLVLQAALASVDQIEVMLSEYRNLIKNTLKRDIPLAITEYNAAYVQEEPKPYRFSTAAALFSGDYLRVLQKPENNIILANYWHFINGYWGMVRGNESSYEKMVAYDIFRLWNNYTGHNIVNSRVESPLIEFEGWGNVKPAKFGNAAEDLVVNLNNVDGPGFYFDAIDNQTLELQLDNYTGELYPHISHIPMQPGRTVQISFESRITGYTGATTRLGIGVIDDRGWSKTKSGFAIDAIADNSEWQHYTAQMSTLPDCSGMAMTFRLISQEAITAKVEVRNLRLSLEEDAPMYPGLTSFSTLSDDNKTLYLIVFNRDHESAITSSIEINGNNILNASYDSISADSLDSFSWNIETGNSIAIQKKARFTHTFPKLSMTAFEIILE